MNWVNKKLRKYAEKEKVLRGQAMPEIRVTGRRLRLVLKKGSACGLGLKEKHLLIIPD